MLHTITHIFDYALQQEETLMCDEPLAPVKVVQLLAPVQPNVTAQGDTVPRIKVVLGGGTIDFAAMTNIYHIRCQVGEIQKLEHVFPIILVLEFQGRNITANMLPQVMCWLNCA